MTENTETNTASNSPAISGIDDSHLVGNSEPRYLFNMLHEFCQQELRPNGILEEFEVFNIANLFLKKWWLLARYMVAHCLMMAKQSQQKGGSVCTEADRKTMSQIFYSIQLPRTWFALYFTRIRNLGILMAADSKDSVLYSLTAIEDDFEPREGDFELAEPFNAFNLFKSRLLEDAEADAEWLTPKVKSRNDEADEDYNCQIDDHVRALLKLKGMISRRRTTTRLKPPRSLKPTRRRKK